jgi:RNA polymerase sigma-32 factor
VTSAALAELATAYRAGNRQAGADLVRALTPLMRSRIRAVGGIGARNPDLRADLEQQAALGVLRAAQLWSRDGGANVLGYASLWIDAFIRQYVRREPIVRRSVTDIEKRAPAVQMLSLDAPFAPDNDASLVDTLACPAATPADEAEAADGRRRDGDQIAHALRCLPPVWREVVRRRWLVAEPETLLSIAESMNLSRERIRQIEQQALQRMARVLGSTVERIRTARVRSAA